MDVIRAIVGGYHGTPYRVLGPHTISVEGKERLVIRAFRPLDEQVFVVDIKSGKRVWQSTAPLSSGRPLGSGTAFIVKHGDHFWMFNELGELIIAKMTPQGYAEIDRAKVIEPSNVAFGRRVVWAAPAWANKKVFVRNDNECVCIDLAAK